MTNRRPRTRRRRNATSDAGTSTVELVITMPALLLMVLAVIQFGLWMHAQHVALAAAQEGARAGRAYGSAEHAAHDRARASLADLGPRILRDPAVDVARTPDEVTVTVTGHATAIVGLFPLPVREQARAPIERFIPRMDAAR
jgi:Flp pilus assembly protein TadG